MILKHSFPRSSRYGRLTWFCLLELVILTLFAACGGSSGSTNSSPTPTPTYAFISDVPTGTPTSASSTPTSAPTTPSQATPSPTAISSRPTPTPTRPSQPTPSPTPTPPPNVTITIITNKSGTFTFSPTTLKVKVGTTVTWNNKTTGLHTSTSDSGVWDSGIIAPSGSFSFKFTTAGTFTYHCNIHPFMKATIMVS